MTKIKAYITTRIDLKSILSIFSGGLSFSLLSVFPVNSYFFAAIFYCTILGVILVSICKLVFKERYHFKLALLAVFLTPIVILGWDLILFIIQQNSQPSY